MRFQDSSDTIFFHKCLESKTCLVVYYSFSVFITFCAYHKTHTALQARQKVVYDITRMSVFCSAVWPWLVQNFGNWIKLPGFGCVAGISTMFDSPVGIYLSFKRCEICTKLTITIKTSIKTSVQVSSLLQILYLVLVFLFLTVSRQFKVLIIIKYIIKKGKKL